MASVLLDRVWLTDAATPTDALAFSSNGRSEKRAQPGEIRSYANGRQRLVTRTGTTRTVGLTAVDLTFAQVQWLASHVGRVMLLRDKPGRKVFGTYLAVDVRDKQAQTVFDVQIEFTELSYDEAL